MSGERIDLEKIERAGKIARLIVMLEEGKTDAQAMDALKLDAEGYRDLKREAMKIEAASLRGRTTEEIFAEYVVHQSGCIRDLTNVARRFDKKKHYSALVAAIRTRSDIYDKIIKTGQEFGIIERKAERKEIGIAVIVSKMTDDQIRRKIIGELGAVSELMENFGEADLIDVEVEAIHRPALPSGQTENRTNKARASKVHRGRRVVKGD